VQPTRTVVAVRSRWGNGSRALTARLRDRELCCVELDDLAAAQTWFTEGGSADVLIVPSDQVADTGRETLGRILESQPLLRVVVVCSRLDEKSADRFSVGDRCRVLDEATAPQAIAALTERMHTGPLPPLAMSAMASEDERRAAEAQACRQLRGAGQSIAVFGPDAAMLNMLVDTLCEYGYEARPSQRVDRVPEHLAEQGFALAVYDAGRDMAETVSVLQQCRRAAPTVPIVVLVAFADSHTVDALQAAGAEACLRKPFELSELLWETRRALREAEPEKPLVSDEELRVLLDRAD